MPYKVVQIQKKTGKLELTAVPSGWEKNNILFWPCTSNSVRIALLKNPQSTPQSAGGKWQKYNCTVKRQNLKSYEKASEEIDVMENQSDTGPSGCDEDKMPAPGKKLLKREKRRVFSVAKNPDSERNNFNEIAENLLENMTPSTPTSSVVVVSQETTAAAKPVSQSTLPDPQKREFELFSAQQEQQQQQQHIYVPPIAEQPLQHIRQQNFGYNPIYAPHQHSQLLQSQQQQYYAPTNKVDTMPVQKQYVNIQLQQQQSYLDATEEALKWTPTADVEGDIGVTTTVIDLSMIVPMLTALQEEMQKLNAKVDLLLANNGRGADAGAINQVPDMTYNFKQIGTIDELKKFNDILKSDPESTAKWVPYFHSLCDKKTFSNKAAPGECALSFWVDFIFAREIFTKCSWAGGSRDKTCPKEAFKDFEYVINFLLDLARTIEPSYTLIAAQNFSKSLLQYSKRRNVAKPMRRSAPKVRPPLGKKKEQCADNSENKYCFIDDNDYEDFGETDFEVFQSLESVAINPTKNEQPAKTTDTTFSTLAVDAASEKQPTLLNHFTDLQEIPDDKQIQNTYNNTVIFDSITIGQINATKKQNRNNSEAIVIKTPSFNVDDEDSFDSPPLVETNEIKDNDGNSISDIDDSILSEFSSDLQTQIAVRKPNTKNNKLFGNMVVTASNAKVVNATAAERSKSIMLLRNKKI